MNRFMRGFTSLIFMLILSYPAFGTYVEYETVNLGGNSWQYTYTAFNDNSSVDVAEITTFFDGSTYTDLTVLNSPANWDSITIAADPAIPADGYFDALALSAGISQGTQLGDFIINFTYLGAGSPGSQLFELRAANSDLLNRGQTVQAQTQVTVPAPAFESLLGVGVLAMAFFRKMR